jgi:hypothetical protein
MREGLVYRRGVRLNDETLNGLDDGSWGAATANDVSPRESEAGRARGFLLDVNDGTGGYRCGDVRGFREALMAADDPRAQVPLRLDLMVPDHAMMRFLARWSEDEVYVRRTVSIRRLFDDKQVITVATLSSFGHGVEPSLAVESVALDAEDLEALFGRSGVHPKATVDAALRSLYGSVER